MTTEERLTKLEKEIEALRLVNDVVHSESLKKRVLQGVINGGVKSSASTSDINVAVTVLPATVARSHTAKMLVQIDGTNYYLGLYPA